MNERLQSIRPRLQELERLHSEALVRLGLDDDMRLTATDTFELAPPLSETEVVAFEAQHGIVLPSDYRQFLLEVGSEGAGPNYGLLPLGGDRSGSLATAFPLHEWLDLTNDRHNLSEDEIASEELVQGALLVSDHGCGIYDLLVISGDERGYIWTDDRANELGIYPVAPNREELGQSQEDTMIFTIAETKNERTSFLDWYEWWLDWCEEEIKYLNEA